MSQEVFNRAKASDELRDTSILLKQYYEKIDELRMREAELTGKIRISILKEGELNSRS